MAKPAITVLLHGALLLLPSAVGVALAALGLFVSWRDAQELQGWWGTSGWVALGVLLTLVGVASLAALFLRGAALLRGRWKPRGLTSLRYAFVALVLGWLVYIVFLQPYLLYRVVVCMATALGIYSLGWLLATRRGARASGRTLRIVDFALFQFCLLAVLFELGITVAGAVTGSRILNQAEYSAEEQIARNRDEAHGLRYGFPANSRGDYDFEPPLPPREATLIVTIGDSFSTGIVPHPMHFTTVAEEQSGLDVYNMGVPGIGPREYEVLLKNEALPLEPDLIVIDLFLGNDVHEAQSLVGFRGLLKRVFVRDMLNTVLVFRRLHKLRKEAAANEGEDGVGELPGSAALDGRSALGPEELSALLPWLDDPAREAASFSVETYDQLELDRARSICLDSGDLEALYRRLKRMREAAGETPFCVMLIPDEFQVEEAVWQRVLHAAPEEDWRRFRAQEELRSWCAAHDIPCLDLLPALRAVEAMDDGRRHLYHLRNSHLNVRGNRVAGEALGRFLSEQLGD